MMNVSPKQPLVPRKPASVSSVSSGSECEICHLRQTKEHPVLMICQMSTCKQAFHPACVQLHRAPKGDWFCTRCKLDRKILARTNAGRLQLQALVLKNDGDDDDAPLVEARSAKSDDSCGSACKLCRGRQKPQQMLMCEGRCEKFFHVGCVGLGAVPKGRWLCNACSSKRSEEDLQARRQWKIAMGIAGLTLVLVADGKLQSPAQLRAQIMRPLQLMQAAAWFFARQSPGMKRHREEPPPPLGHMFTQFSPCVPVRLMCCCVATACRRLATAPAGVNVFYRTTGRCLAAWIMELVTRGRVRRVRVRLQRRACCAVRCACRATACVLCAFDACCRKRWLVFRCVAPHRSGCIKRAAAFIIVCRLLLPNFLPPALHPDATFGTRQQTETALRCFAM
jgi:hypothetical protein